MIILVGLTPLAAGLPAYAASTTTTQQSFWDNFAQFFAQKFNLDKNQVISAITDFRNQHKQHMQQTMQDKEKARLDALVTSGKITSSQEQAILNELVSLRQKYSANNLQNLTPQERHQEFQKKRQELQDWAKSQGIDPTLIMSGSGMRMMHKGLTGSPTPTP